MQTVRVSIPDPALEPVRCNSWIVVDRATGRPVLRPTTARRQAQLISRYEVLTAYAWPCVSTGLREVREQVIKLKAQSRLGTWRGLCVVNIPAFFRQSVD